MMNTMMPYRMNRVPVARNSRSFMDPFADEFFRDFFGGRRVAMDSFRVNVEKLEDKYLLSAELPGMKRENLRVEVEDGVLTITAEYREEKQEGEEKNYLFRERREGSVSRSFNLEGIREEEITAVYEDGVLKLTLPKQVDETKEKRTIAIA